MFLSTITSIGLNTGATRAAMCASQGQFSISVQLWEYIYEDGLFTVRLLSLRLTVTANYCQME